jgi:hypothetical protein
VSEAVRAKGFPCMRVSARINEHANTAVREAHVFGISLAA